LIDSSTTRLNSVEDSVTATRHRERPEAAPVPFGVSVSLQGTTMTVALRGEWDLAQQPTMRAATSDVLQSCPETVVLDLTRLSFIDSTGVRGVIDLHKRSEQQNVHLVIVPGPPAVQRVFELLGLTEILPFLPGRLGYRAARPRSARPGATGSGGSLSPPPATPAAERFSGRRPLHHVNTHASSPRPPHPEYETP
jgi:anti-anti-sigma factor